MSKNDVILHVDHMTKSFGDLKVLNDISFDVRRGEFLCIVGPTGCGKTTFLNCITGLYNLTSGQILVNGEPVDTKKHNIAYFDILRLDAYKHDFVPVHTDQRDHAAAH